MRIIAIDDEQGALKLLVDSIKTASPDSEVVEFSSSIEGLEYSKKKLCDIAFLDIQMYGMTGLELAKELKKTNNKINIIFVTGYDEFAIEAIGLHASGYVTKPVTPEKIKNELGNLVNPLEENKDKFFAKTFGNFDFFVNGKPVVFPRKKSKELLALLIDKEGATVSTEQIASYLYEDRNYDRSIKNMLMPIIRCLQETMNSVGAGDVIIKSWGQMSVDTSKFSCDAYDLIARKKSAIKQFKGEYMSNYSWAEEKCSELYWMMEK